MRPNFDVRAISWNECVSVPYILQYGHGDALLRPRNSVIDITGVVGALIEWCVVITIFIDTFLPLKYSFQIAK